MFGAFHQRFTTYCGVNKMKVIHMTYPQAVYNNGGKKDFTGKNCCFSRFLKEKHLFSVDNSVHSVHKPVKNIKNRKPIMWYVFLSGQNSFSNLFCKYAVCAFVFIW